ncbi:AAA family ATPase [Ensifer adhaerens]|uniref:AAA family ATPase n=1 Tax=Ensifer adhaerens TaxID=106592 RepID=UPI003F8598AE
MHDEMEGRPFELAATACALSLRDTLNDYPRLLESKSIALLVRVPADLEDAYSRPDFVGVEPSLEEFAIAKPTRSSKGKIDFTEVRSTLRVHSKVLVIVGDNAAAPRNILAATDATVVARAIDAPTIVEAVRIVHDSDFSLDAVERMASYPITDVLAAIRKGRGEDKVLARLDEISRAYSWDSDIHPVEKLAGYGAAGDWASDLVADLRHWRNGDVPWSDLDAGLLLSGPPGVGKTLFARSIAKSCGAAFVACSLAQWQSRGHLGDMLAAMRATFHEAAGRTPCVLLIDEFDSIGDRTTFHGENGDYHNQVVAALLECLDGASRREGVVVVGACNHPDRIDAALLRPGRLGTHIRIGLPDRAGRQGILRTHLADALREDEIAVVAAECEAFTGADIADLVKGARRRARKRGEPLNLEDVLSELPPKLPIDGEFRDRICFHEAGHVAVGLSLDVGELTGVAVKDSVRRQVALGGAVFEPRTTCIPTAERFLNNIAVMLAGMAAELLHFGGHLEGSGGSEGSDLHDAADLATMMVAQLGMGGILNHFGATGARERERIRRSLPGINRRVEKILAAQLDRAKEIVRARGLFVCELAETLKREGAVEGARARAMFSAGERSDVT